MHSTLKAVHFSVPYSNKFHTETYPWVLPFYISLQTTTSNRRPKRWFMFSAESNMASVYFIDIVAPNRWFALLGHSGLLQSTSFHLQNCNGE